MEGERLYKACRTCRRQKMACSGIAPCQRCQRAGVACIFESAPLRGRRSRRVGNSRERSFDILSKEISCLKDQVKSLQTQRHLMTPTSGSINRSDIAEETSRLEATTTSASDGNHLTPDDLEAPATTVHVLMHPSPVGEAQRNASGWTAENQSRWNRQDRMESTESKDLLDRGYIDQTEARNLFEAFLGGANAFLRLLDPALDFFDVVRAQSGFTFAVVLYVAARQHTSNDHLTQFATTALEVSRRFAANSLFENPASLETVEAMLILAVHSPKSWFALGHVHQMAGDVLLWQNLTRIIQESADAEAPQECTRYDSRCARVWLTMVYYERAMAVNTSRPSRCDVHASEDLQLYVGHALSGPADVSICASVDLFQRFEKMRQRASVLNLDEVEADLESWWKMWSAHYDRHYVHEQSFQRLHLCVLMLYVRVAGCGLVTSQTIKKRHSGEADSHAHIGARCLHAIEGLLTFIDACEAYKQQFRWSPTFEALLLTYAVVLGFRVSHYFPGVERSCSFLSLVNQAVPLLKAHPCRNFHSAVISLVNCAKAHPKIQGMASDAGLQKNVSDDVQDFTLPWDGIDWNMDVDLASFLDMSNEIGF